MKQDLEKFKEARKVVEHLADGINPVSGEKIHKESFLHHPQVIRSLFYLLEYIDNNEQNKKSKKSKPKTFIITPEEKDKVIFPEEPIGVNQFSKVINEVIDPSCSKKLSGSVINKKLKMMGILSEEIDDEGKRRTVANDKSEGYGIEMKDREFNGRAYKQVVFNDVGKAFLLDNIEGIMEFGSS